MQRSKTVKRTISILTVTQPSTQYRVSAHPLEKSQTSIIYEWRWNRKTACTVVCTIITHFHLYYSCSVHFRRRHHRILYKLTKTLLISFSSQFIQIINFNFVFVWIPFFLFPRKSTFRLIQGSSTDLDTNFITDENAFFHACMKFISNTKNWFGSKHTLHQFNSRQTLFFAQSV